MKTYNSISEVIEMAWCDKTSFDDIYTITGLSESNVIKIMRQSLKLSSFNLWRKRVSGRLAKHTKLLKLKKELPLEHVRIAPDTHGSDDN